MSVLHAQNRLAAADGNDLPLRAPTVTLICDRCGNIEHHVTGILMRAKGRVDQPDGQRDE